VGWRPDDRHAGLPRRPAHPDEPGNRRARTPHIAEDSFDWYPLLVEAQTMSGGESLLVQIAYDLWHAGDDVAIRSLPRQLGPTGFRRVVEALELAAA
jgi:hypothetical protein